MHPQDDTAVSGIHPRSINSADEYKTLVEHFTYLVDTEMKKMESIANENQARDAIFNMPKLISLVNAIGYLRGQDGAFLDVRPREVTRFQSDLFENEDAFEKRLTDIISKLGEFDVGKEYEYRLREYFVGRRVFG